MHTQDDMGRRKHTIHELIVVLKKFMEISLCRMTLKGEREVSKLIFLPIHVLVVAERGVERKMGRVSGTPNLDFPWIALTFDRA
jgi:hypothetical protein